MTTLSNAEVTEAVRAERAGLLTILEALQGRLAQLSAARDSAAALRALAASLSVHPRGELARAARAVLEAGVDVFPAAVADLTSTVESAVGDLPRTAAGTILVVEDNDVARAVLTRTLEGMADRVAVATSMAQARRLLAEGPLPALITLDLKVEDGDCRDLLRELRADPRTHRLPVVVVSAEVGSLPVTDCLALGADAFVLKPFDYRVLRAVVGRLLHRHPA